MTSKQKLLQLAVDGIKGRHWYQTAHNEIERFCHNRGADPDRFIKALAVLSPQVSVEQNIRYTVGLLLFDRPPNVISSVQTGLDRLIDSGYMLSSIRGPKTSAFAKALLGDGDAIVLDVHMGYALKVEPGKLGNKGIQAEAGKRIRWVARQLGWEPAEVQAAIWTAQREKAGYLYSGISSAELERAFRWHADNRT